MTEQKDESSQNDHQAKNSFEFLLEKYFPEESLEEEKIVKGRIVGEVKNNYIVDIGLKVEGCVPIKQCPDSTKIGDTIEVFLEKIENIRGNMVISREKAIREQKWCALEKAWKDSTNVEGFISHKVKGGFSVNINGIYAFLPDSQIDLRLTSDEQIKQGRIHEYKVLKMNKKSRNLVISQRATNSKSLNSINVGDIVEGIVKNIRSYGVFVDLGYADGLLHNMDISCKRVKFPNEHVHLGQVVKVVVLRLCPETGKMALGMKQIQPDPWENIHSKYKINDICKGRVSNVVEYGIFVSLEDGVEALAHASELSWSRRIAPDKMFSTSQEVEAQIIDIDAKNKKISLSIKNLIENPWNKVKDKYTPGSIHDGSVTLVGKSSIWVELERNVEGVVDKKEISWTKQGDKAIADYKKNQEVQVKVLGFSAKRSSLELSLKRVHESPLAEYTLEQNQIVTCTVSATKDSGIEVKFGPEQLLTTFIKKHELSKDRSSQNPNLFTVNDKVDAMVMYANLEDLSFSLSIKSLEIFQQKEAIEKFGSAKSGARLGDVLVDGY